MQAPRAILFDFGDTLLQPDNTASRAVDFVAETLTSRYPALAGHDVAGRYRQLSAERVADMDAALYQPTDDGLNRLRAEVWSQVLTPHGLGMDIAHECAAMQVAYRVEHSAIYPDVVPALEQLSGWMKGLVTNGNGSMVRQRLDHHHLTPYFEVIVVAGEVGMLKPDPAIFRHALDQLGLSPGEVWHVGDSLASDVAGAQSAGIAAVWLNRFRRTLGEDDPLPDMELWSLPELVRLIEGS